MSSYRNREVFNNSSYVMGDDEPVVRKPAPVREKKREARSNLFSLNSFNSQAVGLDSGVQTALKSDYLETVILEQLHGFHYNP